MQKSVNIKKELAKNENFIFTKEVVRKIRIPTHHKSKTSYECCLSIVEIIVERVSKIRKMTELI